jgi:hypothetical protein
LTRVAARPEIKVFISGRDGTCEECGAAVGHSAWICLTEAKGALCLTCADLDHLEFLPSGNAALTRRAKQASSLWAVVLKWSRSRGRYERQGVLVEEKALETAEAACLEDASAREARAHRRAERELLADQRYVERFAEEVRRRYPGCPDGRERIIAEHACRKYSERIGRTGAAKALDGSAIDLAVRAHVRHRETRYDQLLAQGVERHEARGLVASLVDAVAKRWSGLAVVRLRPATPADTDFLRKLHHTAYRDVVVRQFGAWDEADQDAWFEKGIAEARFSIVEESGEAIGAIAVREQAGCLELVELQILSERQNQGLGSLVLEQQMQIASASGKPIRLRVLLENRARALYERSGFAITGQTDTHYLMEWKP